MPLMLEAGRLSALLAPFGRLALRRLAEVPPGMHPVCIELWRVRGGRAEADGVDQHTLSERAAASVGERAARPVAAAVGLGYGMLSGMTGGMMGMWMGPVGWWWGASAGWRAGAVVGQRVAATAMASGAVVAGQTARQLSQLSAGALGSYHEMLVTIPEVIQHGAEDRPYQFVLGMLTDSALAKWWDEAYGFGLNKRLTAISSNAFERYDVHAREGGRLLSATFEATGEEGWRPAREVAGLTELHRWLSRPFLGHRPEGRLVVSHLARFPESPAARFAPASGRLSVHPGLLSGLASGDHAVRGAGPDEPAGAFHARGVPVKFSYPEPFPDRGELAPR